MTRVRPGETRQMALFDLGPQGPTTRMVTRRELVAHASERNPYTLAAMAKLIGVCYGTLRSWERCDPALMAPLNDVRARRYGKFLTDRVRAQRILEVTRAMDRYVMERRTLLGLSGLVGVQPKTLRWWMRLDSALLDLVEAWKRRA